MKINKLRPPSVEEQEILGILAEECCEIGIEVSKINRFGFDSRHPLDPTSNSNLENLEQEIGDFMCMVEILIDKNVISKQVVEMYKFNKYQKLKKYSNITL